MASGSRSRAAKRRTVGLLIAGMLVTGTLNTLCTKIQFTISSVGIDGELEPFRKPWVATFNMLFSMLLVGICDKAWRGFAPAPKSMPLLVDEAPVQDGSAGGLPYSRKVLMVAIPAFFDLAATAFCSVGMLYTPASVWQMLRGSSLVFCALFSITFLRRRMLVFNWIGLVLCVVGTVLVGLANVWGMAPEQQDDAGAPEAAGGGKGDLVFGMTLVLLGQVVQALQIIGEEFLMSSVDLPPMVVVGYEGLFGVLMMLCVVFPVLYVLPGQDGGSMENAFDALVQMSNSQELLGVVLLYTFSCGTFNATGIAVTASLSGVHRMMLDASRTVLIWAFGLWVHYCYDSKSLIGESWTSYSWLQLVGFAVLVTGQAVYGEVLRLPGMSYPPPPLQSVTPAAALKLAGSPLPRPSPA